MNTIKGIFGMLMVTSVLIFMDGCKAEKGEIGPAGATGATGATGAIGAAGATGAKGDKGDTGTANVSYSDWINITFTGSSGNFTATVTAPKITQDILDKGVVLMFIKIGGVVYSVPYAYATSTGTLVGTILPALTVGKITLYGSYNYSNPFRYVIVPGGVSIGGGRKAALESMSYGEIKTLYNIPD
jgi:hypothetical protein